VRQANMMSVLDRGALDQGRVVKAKRDACIASRSQT